MKKVVIPTVLAAMVLLAAILAYIPVEKASTAHTSIISQQVKVFTLAADTDINTGATFTLDCNAVYRVTGLFMEMGPSTYQDDVFDVAVDGTSVADDIVIAPGSGVVAAAAAVNLLDGSEIAAAAAEDVVVTITLATDDGTEDIVEGRATVVTSGTCTFTST